MNRILTTVTTVAAAATATIAVGAALTPALAAHRPAPARPAAHAHAVGHPRAIVRPGTAVRPRIAVPKTLPAEIGRTFGSGTSVTVVRCTRAIATPPVRITPDATRARRAARDHGPASDIAALIERPPIIKAVYTCTVIVEAKTPVTAKKKATHAVRHGQQGCGIRTGISGGTGTGGKGVDCSPVVTLRPGSGDTVARVTASRPLG